MQLPSLNALRTFHTVARLGSVSAAASELSVTIGAVSRQIKSLEECIGIALVTRDGRGVRLTEDGKELQHGLADAFMQIAESVDRIRAPVRGERLRIVVPPIFASTWLVPRLDRFKAQRPQADIILVDSRERVGPSGGGEVVIEWGTFEEDSKTVAQRLSGREEIFPVCSPNVSPGSGLAGATLLHRELTQSNWNWPDWPTFLDEVGLSGADVADGPALTARLLLEATREGKGVALTNTTVACADLASGRLVRPVDESLKVDDGYWALIQRPAYGRPEVAAFVRWLGQEFEGCRCRGEN